LSDSGFSGDLFHLGKSLFEHLIDHGVAGHDQPHGLGDGIVAPRHFPGDDGFLSLVSWWFKKLTNAVPACRRALLDMVEKGLT
jgi:hypothetical protein